MNLYQALKDICLDLGVSSDNLSEPDAISNEDFSIVIRDINFKTILDNIRENLYYNKLVRKVTPEEVYILDKLYIHDNWTNILLTFSDTDIGVNVEIETFSVDYFTEDGENMNVENLDIADALRDYEVRKLV